MGRLRIYATHLAAAVVVPIWGRFLSTYPEVHLELAAGESPIDIVARGFDAGIGPRDRAPADLIAVRVSAPLKFVVVGARAILRAAAAAHAGRSRTPQLRGISAGDERVQMAVRAQPQIAAKRGGWAGDGEHSDLSVPRSTGSASHTRSRRWPSHSYAGTIGARAGGLVAVV